MKIVSKVNKFYRLATLETDDAEAYQTALKTMLGRTGLYSIVEFLRDWSDSPFFRMDDIKDHLLTITSTMSISFSRQLDAWDVVFTAVENSQNISQEIKKKIVNMIAENYIENASEFTGWDYIDMERHTFITPEVLKLAQRRVLLEVMNELQKEDKDDTVNAYELLQNLSLSNKIPKNLVEGLAKRFGPEFYGALYSNLRGGRTVTMEAKHFWRKKKKISIWDISEFLGTFLDYPLEAEFIKSMIDRSDSEAKNYWRRFLYAAGPYYNGLKETFMLDESMEPMDMDYNHIEWPREVRILALTQIVTNEREDLEIFINKWKRIFGDFGIIPR